MRPCSSARARWAWRGLCRSGSICRDLAVTSPPHARPRRVSSIHDSAPRRRDQPAPAGSNALDINDVPGRASATAKFPLPIYSLLLQSRRRRFFVREHMSINSTYRPAAAFDHVSQVVRTDQIAAAKGSGGGKPGGGGDGGDPALHTTYTSGGDESGFNITINYSGTWTAKQQAVVEWAAELISDIIVGDITDDIDPRSGNAVDDLVLSMSIGRIDSFWQCSSSDSDHVHKNRRNPGRVVTRHVVDRARFN